MDNPAYTRHQIMLGSFVGGPFAAIYFLKKNFDAMGDTAQSKKTVIIGLCLVVALLAIMAAPLPIPRVVYPVAYAALAQAIYMQKQISLKDTPSFSNKNVAIIAAISFIAFAAILLILVYVAYAFGITG